MLQCNLQTRLAHPQVAVEIIVRNVDVSAPFCRLRPPMQLALLPRRHFIRVFGGRHYLGSLLCSGLTRTVSFSQLSPWISRRFFTERNQISTWSSPKRAEVHVSSLFQCETLEV